MAFPPVINACTCGDRGGRVNGMRRGGGGDRGDGVSSGLVEAGQSAEAAARHSLGHFRAERLRGPQLHPPRRAGLSGTIPYVIFFVFLVCLLADTFFSCSEELHFK